MRSVAQNHGDSTMSMSKNGRFISFDAIHWAWEQQTRRSADRLVLLNLAYHADAGTFSCHPSIDLIAGETRLHRQTVMDAVARLADDRMIDVSKKNGAGNGYRLMIDTETSTKNRTGESTESDESGIPSSTKNRTGSSTKNRTGRSTGSDEIGIQTSTKNRTGTSTKNRTGKTKNQYEKPYCKEYKGNNNKISPSGRTRAREATSGDADISTAVAHQPQPQPQPQPKQPAQKSGTGTGYGKEAVAALMAHDVSQQVADDYLTTRKAKRSPLTPTALKGLEREAAKLGITVAKAIEICCVKGWVSIMASWPSAQEAAGKIEGHSSAYQTREERRLAANRRAVEEFVNGSSGDGITIDASAEVVTW